MKLITTILASVFFICFSKIAIAQDVSWSENLIEDLHVEINKSFFIPGEELNVAIESDVVNHSFQISKIAYLELIDPANYPVIQEKVVLIDGKGSATIYLPSHLKTGNYTLLVYTKWMRNFGNSKIIQRKISLVNPFIEIPKDLFRNNQPVDSLHIKLFPEGGNFIIGERQLVAYRIENKQGEAVLAKIRIQDSEANIVLDISSPLDHGYFFIEPKLESVYVITLIDYLDRIHFSRYEIHGLPKQVTRVKSTASYFEISELNVSKLDRLVIWNNHLKIQDILIDSVRYRFSKSQLPKGLLICQIVGQDESVKYSKLLFNEPQKVEVNVNLDKKKYAPREKISISITSDWPMQATLVIRKTQILLSQENGVSNHFLGKYDFTFQWPEQTVDETALLMYDELTSVTSNQKSTRYLPDFRGELISGVLHDPKDQIVPNQDFYVSVKGDAYDIYTASTNEEGIFNFSINPNHSVDQLIFSNIKNYKVDIDQPFLSNYDFIKPSRLILDIRELEKWLILRSKQVQIKNLYDDLAGKEIETKGLFYNENKMVYNLDDYTRFQTVADHLIEIIPSIEIRGGNNEKEFFIRNVNNRDQNYNYVLSTLNGIVCSADEILEYDPLKIQKVEIYPTQFQLGNLVITGAVNFLTYPDIQVNNKAFNNSAVIPHRGVINLNADIKKNIPDSLAKIPDMRTQLAWEPHLTLNANTTKLSYRASDVPGIYEIVVSGVSNDKFIFERIEFEVSNR